MLKKVEKWPESAICYVTTKVYWTKNLVDSFALTILEVGLAASNFQVAP